MHPRQDKPLDFEKSDNPVSQQAIGKNKQINPMHLIPPQIQPQNPSRYQDATGEGKFVNDYLNEAQSTFKGKGISKQNKRALYKTKMCPYGRQCNRKLTCTYAHTELQLRKPFIKRTKPCILYQMGKCHLGSICRDYHGNMDLKKKNYKYKADVCQMFLEGRCDKGAVCIFKHEYPQVILQEASQFQQELTMKNDTKQEVLLIQQVKEQNKKVDAKTIVQVLVQKLDQNQQFVQEGLCFDFTNVS